MFKLVTIVLASLMFLSVGCKVDETRAETKVPTHTTIHAGSRQNVLNIECGQACVLVRSADDKAFVAILADGSTITFTFDE